MTRKHSDPLPELPHFTGFGSDALEFLTALSDNQDRAWFNDNKHTYESAVHEPMMALISDLSDALAQRGLPLRGDPKRSQFRLNRDIRFSKDKRPYKTHAGATLTRDAEKMSDGLLYIHIDPRGSFTAAGFYRPAPDALSAIRDRITTKPEAFHNTLHALAKGNLALSPDEDALKRLPRGYEAFTDPEIGDAIRRRTFIVRQNLSPSQIASASLVEVLADFAQRAAPLLTFGWQAVTG